MRYILPIRLWVFILWSILIATSLYTRPLLPVDETRYAAVTWEMWCRHNFLIPYLNGETYSHKPPLLFWLIALSWKLLGVNEVSLRIISPLFFFGYFVFIRKRRPSFMAEPEGAS